MSLLGKIISAPFRAVGALFQALVKIPKPDTTQADPVYELRTGNSPVRVGDPAAWLFGESSFYPSLLSRWTEFRGKQQIEHLLFEICYGPCQPLQITNGDQPFAATASVRQQFAQPGERTTLGNASVYVKNFDQPLELLGGALDLQPYEANVTFDVGGAVTVNSSAQPFDGRGPGDRFTVTGGSNAVEWVLDTVADSRHATAHRRDGSAIVAETADVTLNMYVVAIGGGGGFAYQLRSLVETADDDDGNPENIAVTFDPGDGVTGTVELPGDDYWGDLAVPDDIQSARGLNAGQDFALLAISGKFGILRPAPVAETLTTSLVRVRRLYGPFDLCAPGQVIDGFNVNIIAQAGIYRTNSKGKLRTATVGFEPLIQLVDDAGNALGSLTSLGEQEMSGRDRTVQRESFPFTGLATGRYQLYLARTSPATDDDGRSDALSVHSLVGFVVTGAVDPAYSEYTTRLQMVVQSNAALSGELKVKVRARGMHALWDGAAWTVPQPTESVAAAWSALLRAAGRSVDIERWTALHTDCAARGWKYHAYLTGSMTLADAVEEVLRAGDARRWLNWTTGLRTLWMDREPGAPVLMLHDDNVDESGNDDLDFGAIPVDAPTGLYVEYTDRRTGEAREVLVGDAERAESYQLKGVTSRQQAFELGYRELMRTLYRRQSLEGDVLWIQRHRGLGDAALVQSYQHGLGQMGSLQSAAGLVLVSDTAFEWHPSLPHRVWLVDREAVPSAPIACLRGVSDQHLVLAVSPGALDLGEDGGEPTVLILGHEGREPAKALVAGIGESSDDYIATITALLDAPEVYADPGPAPPDEYPASGEPPELIIDDLVLALGDGMVLATWTPPPEAFATVLEYRRPGLPDWTPIDPVFGGSAGIEIVSSGLYEVRVYALGPMGAIGPLSDPASIEIAPLPLSVTIRPPATTAMAYGTSARLYTNPVEVFVTGGVAPVTGGWVYVSGSEDISAANAAITRTSWTNDVDLARGGYVSGVWRYEAEDSLGATAASPSVPISIERALNSGPGGVEY